MTALPKTHWKKLINPDYLGAYSFDDGEGGSKDKILTIKAAKTESVKGPDGEEVCLVVRWVESEKPLILNSTNAKSIQKILKSPYIEMWAGRKIQLFATQVKAFGEMVDAVRVRPYTPKDSPACEECGEDIKPANGRTALYLAQYTKGKYGRCLCAACATKANQTPPKQEEPKQAEPKQEQVELDDPTAE